MQMSVRLRRTWQAVMRIESSHLGKGRHDHQRIGL